MSEAALLKLQHWLSPAFPVGAFAYSHGLERAVAAGWVKDRKSLRQWLASLVTAGSLKSEAVLFAAAWKAAAARDDALLAEIAELAEALAPSAERRLETMAQGEAFAAALGTPPRPWPVAVAGAAAGEGLALKVALAAFLQAGVVNLASAAQRTIPIGQKDALAVVDALRPDILAIAQWAEGSGLDDLGSASLLSDIASMQHEAQETRLFRS
ncbi:urease accessory protein UreF [Afifella sp. IM 167]|uniref:urease accessory protein UreF n=1 Tax=Afifella sp. IM 167 TaxID=2033586 RepID=UPI001CCF2D8D|nr:urease accessory UreF family protein [Afifella sp. IM 167]MBZ8134038.1 urease accessory protein UreF [Afifella sp. IM 167]